MKRARKADARRAARRRGEKGGAGKPSPDSPGDDRSDSDAPDPKRRPKEELASTPDGTVIVTREYLRLKAERDLKRALTSGL